LETLLFSRWRRQTRESTLKAIKGNGFGILLVDGKGTRIGVRKHPRKRGGSLLKPVPYVPGDEQLSIEAELGHPIGGETGIPEPRGYRLYVSWWPGSLGLGGAVLLAGVLTDHVQILYGSTPLPAPVMEDRSKAVGLVSGHGSAAGSKGSGKRRRDDDFGEIEGKQEEAPPQTS
jgi:hypothetical protein